MASLKKCIEEKCKQCTYDSSQAGSWRHQVEACNVKSCPLWEVRPVTMETMIARRRGKISLDALVDGLDDEESTDGTPETVAA